jgi:shikimate dehydrogenase
MIKASVIGWPIAHSRSPLIHGHWLKQHGIDGSYEKIPVAPENLETFLQTLRSGAYVGTNVTIPHKEAAMAFVDDADDSVRRIGSLNTIWRENGKLRATSTDGYGFVTNVNATLAGFRWDSSVATVLGAGGSARAIIYEMLQNAVERIHVCNRTFSRAQHLAAFFGPRVHAVQVEHLTSVLSDTDIFINTTAAGLNGELGFEISWGSLKPESVVADIVYTPLVTPFLRSAEQRGHAVVPGLGMLLHQAVPGFQHWFGVRPTVTRDLHDLVARDIDPDYQP